MGLALLSNLQDRSIETMRVKAVYHREYIADLTDAEAKAYLLQVIERDMAEAQEGFGRIKDAVPHADRQGAQILDILWNARPRIKTYSCISQELEYLNGRYPDERALSSAVKRLRRALEKTKYPIRICAHYGIGYNLDVPADWRAPWENL